ncbi:MAG: hypothetical protein PHN92_06500 [Geobacter sp.]|nr:hypothetical protein [Geobacter sp.]
MLEEIKRLYKAWALQQKTLPEQDQMKAFLAWAMEHPEQYTEDQRLSLGWMAHRLGMIKFQPSRFPARHATYFHPFLLDCLCCCYSQLLRTDSLQNSC